VASGNSAQSAPAYGSRLAKVSPEEASANLPPMYIRNRSSAGADVMTADLLDWRITCASRYPHPLLTSGSR